MTITVIQRSRTVNVSLGHRYKIPIASYKGLNNASKTPLLIYLALIAASDNPRMITAREIADSIPDFKVNYLQTRGQKLKEYGYIQRELVRGKGTRSNFVYCICLEKSGRLFSHVPETKFMKWLNSIVERNPELAEPGKRLAEVVRPYLKKVITRPVPNSEQSEPQPDMIDLAAKKVLGLFTIINNYNFEVYYFADGQWTVKYSQFGDRPYAAVRIENRELADKLLASIHDGKVSKADLEAAGLDPEWLWK